MQKYAQICWLAMCSLVLLTGLAALAQSTSTPLDSLGTSSPGTPSKFVLEDGTPVKLRIGRTVSSVNAQVGDSVDFVAVHDVLVGNTPVISSGTIAFGTVVEAHTKRRMGRGGKLSIRLDSIKLSTGDKVVLRSVMAVKGGGNTTAMATGMAVTAAAFLPAAPVLLFVRGKDSVILEGTEFTAYVNGNLLLDPLNFKPSPASVMPVPSTTNLDPASPTRIEIHSPAMNQIVELLPRRVLDSNGLEGDMVNLLFIGTQEQLERAFAQAGWIKTIHSMRQTILHATHHPKNNVVMPMSRLYLFGRRQDYSFVMEDSVSTTTRRHHLRIWKTDSEIAGSPVWVGAATHDIGVEKDARKLTITHKIDPEVDAERDFVGSTMMKTMLVTENAYLPPPSDRITKAHTATGGNYHSDGRMLLLLLGENQGLLSAASAMGKGH